MPPLTTTRCRQIVGTTSYLLQAGPSSSDHATAYSEVPNHSPEIHVLAQREPWQTMCVLLDFRDEEADRVRALSLSPLDLEVEG